MEREKILLVDDEEEIRELVGLYIKREGFVFLEAASGKEAIEKIHRDKPDLIVLDVYLPDTDGVEICRQARQTTTVPILFLSCKDSELDKVVGLSVGGDDYISKPFGMNELVARIKAHLRRNRMFAGPAAHCSDRKGTLSSDSLTLDLNSHDVFLHGKKIHLSAKEFQLLSFFMHHPRQVFSVEHLLRKIWGFDSLIDHKTIAVHIGNLRKKLQQGSKQEEIIVTVRGAGYKFNEQVQAL